MATSEFLSTQEERLRIVIVGMNGTGKTSTSNTILGRRWFRILPRMNPFYSDCSEDSAVVDGQHISVIDTDWRFSVSNCAWLSAPGPHVFLLVSRLGRLNEDEKQLMEDMKEKFSPDVDRYCMVLFTGGDQLEDTMEELLDRSPDQRDLVARCNGRYHVFNNKLKDQSQVTELLLKVRNMVQENRGRHYTNDMFKEEMRKIEEEKQLWETMMEEDEQLRQAEEEEEEQLRQAEEEEDEQLRQAEEEEERGGQSAESSCNIM